VVEFVEFVEKPHPRQIHPLDAHPLLSHFPSLWWRGASHPRFKATDLLAFDKAKGARILLYKPTAVIHRLHFSILLIIQ
jgi:hypothetical protein